MVWTLLWSLLVTEKPWIRIHEVSKDQEETGIPWTAFARCLPLWAIIIVETSTGKLKKLWSETLHKGQQERRLGILPLAVFTHVTEDSLTC